MMEQNTLQKILHELINYQFAVINVKTKKIERRFRFLGLMKELLNTRFYEETNQQQKIFLSDLLKTKRTYLRTGQEIIITQKIK